MKTMLSCVVLAALMALVSADGNCDFAFKSGKNCSDSFCASLKAELDKCKENPPAKARRSPGSSEGSLEKSGPKNKHGGFGKMQKCTEDAVKAVAAQGDLQYNQIAEFCEGTTVDTEDESENKIRKHFNMCLEGNAKSCCGIQHHFGGGHGKGPGPHGDWHGKGSGPHGDGHGKRGEGHGHHGHEDNDAGFMTPESEIMAMFY